MSENERVSPQSYLPLTPVVFQILLALTDQERHGYGIMKEVSDRTDGSVTIRPGYTFRVAPKTNRIEIKQAIEEIFDVKVKKVNTSQVRGKRKRLGTTIGFTRGYKKAVVTLYPGHKIEVY